MVQSQEKLPETSQTEMKLIKICGNPIDLNFSNVINRPTFIEI